MSQSLLLLLPGELREQIYLHYFTSPSGFITFDDGWNCEGDWLWPTLVKINPHNPRTGQHIDFGCPISLSILRLCKQVYAECQGVMLWKKNALFLHPQDLSSLLTWPTLAAQMRERLAHVQLQAALFAPSGGALSRFKKTMSTLETIVSWSRNKSSMLRVVELRIPGNISKETIHRTRGIRELYLTLFKSVGGQDDKGLPDWVQKRLLFDQTEPNAGGREGQHSLETLLNVEGPLVQLHGAFGGELWVDGKLCYVAGLRVVKNVPQ